ncbi:lipopolysaccharide assembly protein LapA domain-containing protein [Uliginosibacterium gangwonense]|uniref:lipopolysaccharide assembly protein LapA domain-containing protein n=1 Tax=Uliginosibacterium gangwonense TaxID=392736 RepID=UPI0003A00AC5|nr:LapA family protein [Uliginosibacterium gangwonense]
MRILLWILRVTLFLLLLAFAIKNDQLVRLQMFFDSAWDVPLVVVIFVSFVLGVLIGAGALLNTIIGLRRELAAAKEQQPAPLSAVTPTRLRGQFSDLPDSF